MPEFHPTALLAKGNQGVGPEVLSRRRKDQPVGNLNRGLLRLWFANGLPAGRRPPRPAIDADVGEPAGLQNRLETVFDLIDPIRQLKRQTAGSREAVVPEF